MLSKKVKQKRQSNKKPSRMINEIRGAWALAEKRWRIEMRYPLSLLYFAVAPILWLLPQLIYGSALIGGRYSDTLESLTGTSDVWVYTSLGLVFNMFIAITLWSTAYGIRREEWTGTFEILYITPISRITIIFGNALKSLMHNSIGLFIQLGVIVYWYWGMFAWKDLVISLLFLLVCILLIQGLAMILSGFVLWQKQGYRAVMFIQVLMEIVTPVTYPIVTMPTYLQYLAYANPITYGIEGFRNAIMFGTNWLTFLYLGILLGLGIIVTIIGVKSFASMEKILRSKGTIGQY
ncbi:MAG: ABC transporter permease [Candidatus Heimdallarchaeota archaeon]